MAVRWGVLRKKNLILMMVSLGLQANAGVMDIIHFQPSGSSGSLAVLASASGVVSLQIEDNPTGGGNLVSGSGINFGDVNNLGTTQTPGINAWPIGKIGHYEARFSLTAERSGEGTITLHCSRPQPGNFNANNGVEIENDKGQLKPLSAHFEQTVDVLSNAVSGTYDKRIAINIYPQDRGQLKTVLKFTMCAL